MDIVAAEQIANGALWVGLEVVTCAIAVHFFIIRQDKERCKYEQERAFNLRLPRH